MFQFNYKLKVAERVKAKCERHRFTTLDDLNETSIARLSADGFNPCAVIETSAGNFQAWLKHSRVFPKLLGTFAAQTLAGRYDADPSAADWRRFGRLPGFTNCKPKYRKPDGLFPFVRLHSYNGHPHYGQTVTLGRRCSSFGRSQVQVAFPDGRQLLVPEWMLDEDLCRGVEVAERPRLAISALLALRELLDAQQHSSPSVSILLEASSQGGAFHEPSTPGSSSLGDSSQTGTSTSNRTALPRAAVPHASKSGDLHNSQRGGQ
jgi:hypothetical protein